MGEADHFGIDMIVVEEERLKHRDEELKEYEAEHHKKLVKKTKKASKRDEHPENGAGENGKTEQTHDEKTPDKKGKSS